MRTATSILLDIVSIVHLMDKKWIDGMKLNLSIIIIIIEMVKEGVIMKYKMEIPEAYHVSIISS